VIGLDTNILVRYIEQDDAEQALTATRLIEGFTATEPGFISIVVVTELVWILQRLYKRSKADVLSMITGLLGSRELVVEQSDLVIRAVRDASAGSDFADCLIVVLGERAGCDKTVTFDRKAARTAGMSLLA